MYQRQPADEPPAVVIDWKSVGRGLCQLFAHPALIASPSSTLWIGRVENSIHGA
jgi:hypothetical protein